MDRRALVAAVGVLALLGGGASANSVVNGDFSAGLTGWTTSGPVVDAGGVALLMENAPSLLTTIQQQVVIPAGAASLSFDYQMLSTPIGTPVSPFPDAFAASLLDPVSFAPLLHTPGFPDYYEQDRGGAPSFDPSLVSVSGGTVRLDLSSLPAGTDALIVFDLIGSDDGFATEVALDNVTISLIPEPLTMLAVPLAAVAVLGYMRRRRPLHEWQ